MILVFSTADVVVPIVRLATIWPLAQRYGNLFPDKLDVFPIVIRPLDKSGGATVNADVNGE